MSGAEAWRACLAAVALILPCYALLTMARPHPCTQVQEQTGESIGAAPSAQRSPSPDRRSAGRARLAALAALLEEVQAQGRRITLAELRQAGYSTNDLHALRQWLGQQ